jgi:hypothetical protein
MAARITALFAASLLEAKLIGEEIDIFATSCVPTQLANRSA